MKGPEKMMIYNLFPPLVGELSKWEPHLSRASQMGFNWIFVNPIQLPGGSGSLYSISDYFRFNPLFVDAKSKEDPQDQVRNTIREAEKMGLHMMIDLVVNHCSTDSTLLKSHPGWFLWESKGKVAHPFADQNGKKVVWGDLAKFDHKHTKDKEGLFQFFFKVATFLVDLGFKGFRCDAAYQVPKSFWERLIRETKRKDSDVRFFAETLGCTPDQTAETARAGFDYIFNSAKWWDFKSGWLMKQYTLTRDVSPSIAFPESHDTPRLCEELNGNVEGLKQRYLFTALFSTGVMMPIGFEFGFRKKPDVVKTRPGDWEETEIDLTSFITKVNEIKAEHSIFREDAATEMIQAGNPNVLVMWKGSPPLKEEALVILNKDIDNRQGFHADTLQDFMEAKAVLTDVSPEYPLDHIPTPFSYDLRPGQGIVMVTSREQTKEV
jgi:starch synthase (maltosyl-transferring)